jgi:hypothetical protein
MSRRGIWDQGCRVLVGFVTAILTWLEAEEIGDVFVAFLFGSREARLRNFVAR